MTLHKYLTNIYLCWEFALPTSTLLDISRNFNANLNDSKDIFYPPLPLPLGFPLITQKQ